MKYFGTMTDNKDLVNKQYVDTTISTATNGLASEQYVNGIANDLSDAMNIGFGTVNSNTANEYSASQTYPLGSLCLRSGRLYKCTTAITTPEAWNSSHWNTTEIGTELEELASDISANQQNIAPYFVPLGSYNEGDYVIDSESGILYRCTNDVSGQGSIDLNYWTQVDIAQEIQSAHSSGSAVILGWSDSVESDTVKIATTDSPLGRSFQDGDLVAINFTYSNTDTAPKLNVNGTGALDIIRNYGSGGNMNVGGDWAEGEFVLFMFHGSLWWIVGSTFGEMNNLSKKVTALETKIPDPPSQDGTYKLYVSVFSAGGDPFYYWGT